MPENRGFRIAWIAGSLGIGSALAAGFFYWKTDSSRFTPVTEVSEVSEQRQAKFDTSSPLDQVSAGIEKGEGLALAVLQKRLLANEAPHPAVSVEESAQWQTMMEALRKGNLKYSGYGRANIVTLAGRIVELYALDPAPLDWSGGLIPFTELTAQALADSDPGVRIAAIQQVGRLWNWSPGRDMHPGQVEHVAAWKEGLLTLSTRALSDKEPQVRASAVLAMSALSLDDKAAPALALLEDESADVRLAVLSGFAKRRTLLDEEAIIPFLSDPTPGLAATAEHILKERGLSEVQLGLAQLVVHHQEALRLSAIEMVQDRTDIDGTLWLVFLSRDRSESVRAKAMEALARSNRPEAQRRLSEMAQDDPSEDIRQAASKVATDAGVESTASLPPLPGSHSLIPKAN